MGADAVSWWLCAALAAGAGSNGPATKAKGRLSILYSVQNAAGVPALALRTAHAEVRRLFDDIGIELAHQQQGAWLQAFETPSAQACRSDLLVLVVSEKTFRTGRTDSGALGFTARSDGTGPRAAFVAYERAVALAARFEVPAGTLLGYAIAHELTHLLLPLDGHTGLGLMSERWLASDIIAAARGHLRFSSGKKNAIRQRVATLRGSGISWSCPTASTRGIQ